MRELPKLMRTRDCKSGSPGGGVCKAIIMLNYGADLSP